MRFAALSCVLVAMFAASAAAQTAPNPILEHFRAYQAAWAAGDLESAEAEAVAALAASDERDGDGGRTAVLALNLANVRLERRLRGEAIAPAQRAIDIVAARGPAAHVDPVMARLTLARARLSEQVAAKDELRAALDLAASNADLAAYVYQAAVELGHQELADHRFRQSTSAWEIAVSTSNAAPIDGTLARADALILQGLSLMYQGAALPRSMTLSDEDAAAHEKLRAAMALLADSFSIDGENASLSPRQRSFLTARVWSAALNARLSQIDPPWLRDEEPIRMTNATAPQCEYRMIVWPRPHYPGEAADNFTVGAVVVRLEIDGEDQIVSRSIVVAAPNDGPFIRAVTRVYDLWRVERMETATECQTRSVIYPIVAFNIGE